MRLWILENAMTTRSGKLKCAACGSDVTISSRTYGGLQRWVCSVQTCINSEIALDPEDSNDL